MDFESVIAVIALAGGGLLCGGSLLLFAAISFYGYKKHSQAFASISAARKTTVAALKPGPGLVRLQGNIAGCPAPIDGPAATPLVYLRLRVEQYQSGEDGGWSPLTDKWRGVPFQLEDGSGSAWVEPEGLNRHMLGEGFVPDEHQMMAACILLGISPKILRGQLRYQMWELRGGQTITVVGAAAQRPNGLTILKPEKQPFVVTPLLGEAVIGTVGVQKKGTHTLALALGIPGLLILCCGLGGAAVTLVKLLLNS